MAQYLFIDIETFSSVDLKRAGVYRYTESPDFEIMIGGWTTDKVNYHAALGEAAIQNIPHLWDPDIKKVAHNAAFERICFSTLRNVFYLPPEDWIDTMAIAAENGLPKGLDNLARALGAEPKDMAGTHLINFFCKPYRGRRRLPKHHPEKWKKFVNYGIQDVRTLVDVWDRLPDWPTETERRLFFIDQKINDRGIRIDTQLARKAVQAAVKNGQRDKAEVTKITGIENPNSHQQFTAWLSESGLRLPNLRAETVETALSGSLTGPQRRVLELRQELALTTSKKYVAALRAVSEDHRLRGMFNFYGAHTGRWSSRRVQLQNLTRATVDDVDMAILDLMLGNGADSKTLKALIRSMFILDGSVVDYDAIEARIVAWLAGEQWVLDAARAGRDLYVETAERMGGLTRFQGKIAVLALGFGGGVNSLRHMGAEGDNDELQAMVNLWRAANPKTVRLWKRLEACLRRGGTAGRLTVKRRGKDVYIYLPSGRPLVYHDMRWEKDPVTGHLAQTEGWRFSDPRGFRMPTYGGRLTENATQATARDVLAEALIRLEEAGYAVVGHVHDEVMSESQEVQQIADLMCQPPEWADGLPIDASGEVVKRYRKLD